MDPDISCLLQRLIIIMILFNIIASRKEINISIENGYLEGILCVPEKHLGNLVIFVHGSGSSQFSSRNEYLSEVLNRSGVSTLLVNLLSVSESAIDNKTQKYRFNIELLTDRLLTITDAMLQNELTRSFRLGYFASSTGTAAAVRAAVQRYDSVLTIVSRSGRLDLVDLYSLRNLRSSILILIGGRDSSITDISYKLFKEINMHTVKKIVEIPGATHLFSEAGKIEQIARLALGWYAEKL
jgi:pimeloyl-ACP methyl ester carboxylesterase